MVKSGAELKRDEAMLALTRAVETSSKAWAEARVAKQVAMAADSLELAARLEEEKASAEFEKERVNEMCEKLRGGA
jgi:hypothetical protein